MSIHRETPIPVSVPFPVAYSQQALPRIFSIEYDNSKVKINRSGKYREDVRIFKEKKLFQWGTQYPGGSVTLETGVYFACWHELELFMDGNGDYAVTWLDGEPA